MISAEGMLRNCSRTQISPLLAQRTQAGMTDNITYLHKSMVTTWIQHFKRKHSTRMRTSRLETMYALVTITRCRYEGGPQMNKFEYVSCDYQV